METSKGVKIYKTVILILMIVMALVFAVIYFVANSRVGFEYKGAILVPSQENSSTVYSGEIQGRPVCITVSADKTVVFQCDSKTYGPYTAKEDPTAIPKDNGSAQYMTGVELRKGEEILFRGGVIKNEDYYMLFKEDESMDSIFSSGGSSGVSLEPSVSDILELMDGPKLTHKGLWGVWFGAVLICGMNALSIFFEEDLFYWRLQWWTRNAENAEPSDLTITCRCISWTAVTIIAFGLFMFGLQH